MYSVLFKSLAAAAVDLQEMRRSIKERAERYLMRAEQQIIIIVVVGYRVVVHSLLIIHSFIHIYTQRGRE